MPISWTQTKHECVSCRFARFCEENHHTILPTIQPQIMLHSTTRVSAFVVLLLFVMHDTATIAAPVPMRDWGEITGRLYPYTSNSYFPDYYYVRPYLRPQSAAVVRPKPQQTNLESTVRLRRGNPTPEPVFVPERPQRRGYTAWELSRKRRSTDVDTDLTRPPRQSLSDLGSTAFAASQSLLLSSQRSRTAGDSPGIDEANKYDRPAHSVWDSSRRRRRRRRHQLLNEITA